MRNLRWVLNNDDNELYSLSVLLALKWYYDQKFNFFFLWTSKLRQLNTKLPKFFKPLFKRDTCLF